MRATPIWKRFELYSGRLLAVSNELLDREGGLNRLASRSPDRARPPATDRPCGDFGRSGVVRSPRGIEPLVDAWEHHVTSLPTVVGGVVIVGFSIADIVRRVQPPGMVRA